MTFKGIIKVIGYVNKVCGGYGMLVRWALKHVYTL